MEKENIIISEGDRPIKNNYIYLDMAELREKYLKPEPSN